MSDESRICKLRIIVDELTRQRAGALSRGASVHLLTSDTVIATLRGILDESPNAGEQPTERGGAVAQKAIIGGASFAVGSIGYTHKP